MGQSQWLRYAVAATAIQYPANGYRQINLMADGNIDRSGPGAGSQGHPDNLTLIYYVSVATCIRLRYLVGAA